MLGRRVDDLIHSKLARHLDLETCFFLEFPSRSLGNTLKSMYFTAGNYPASPLGILVPLPEKNTIGFVANQECGADAWESFSHNLVNAGFIQRCSVSQYQIPA